MRHVVIVYSRVGGGHFSAARALAEAFEDSGRATAKVVDAYLECGRLPVTLFPPAYARLARRHPRLWAMVYRGSRRLDPKRVLGPFLQPGFRRLMGEERPDLVVSVLPGINGLLAEAASALDTGLEVVLTDWHSVHRFWVAPGVAHYTTPTESARQDCIRFGAREAAVSVVGIPVRQAFAVGISVREAFEAQASEARTGCLTALGLDPWRFTVLAMVGAEGSPRALANVAALARLDRDIQLLVICGRNAELRRQVERIQTRMPVLALGFVENVAELMRSADILVTKAGGLTLAEAFCCGVPIVVHDVLPGQEAGNLGYVLQQQAVEHAPSWEALVQLIAELYDDAPRRASLAERGGRLARPDAAREIVRELLGRLTPS